MDFEFQKFYRYILPGAILVASDCIILKDYFRVTFYNIESAKNFILLLAMFAIIAGVFLYLIFIVWHLLFEKNKMQSKEVEWLNSGIELTKENIFHYSNIIWYHLDSKKDYEQNANWFRNNLLLMSSIGCSIGALIFGIIFIVIYSLYIGYIFLLKTIVALIISVLLFFSLVYYRNYLKKRYMERLKIFIRINSKQILTDKNKYDKNQLQNPEPSGSDGLVG